MTDGTPAPADTVTPPAGGQTPPPAAPSGNADWRSLLPEDIRADPGLQKYTSIESLAKGYLNAQRMIGYEKVPIPKSEDDWNRWYEAAGRPADPNGYEFKEVQLPEGMTYNAELEGKFKEIAHQAGLNPRQAQNLRDWFTAAQAEAFQNETRAFTETKAQAELALKRELGAAYDGYLAAAKAAIAEYTNPEFVAFLDQSGMGNHPEIVKAFGKIGRELLGESKLKAAGVVQEATPAELDAKIAEFRSSHSRELYDKTHPDHARLTNELTAMYAKRFPNEPR